MLLIWLFVQWKFLPHLIYLKTFFAFSSQMTSKKSTTVKRNNQISIILNPYDRDVRSVLQKNSSPLLHVILATITAHASRVTNNKINAPLGDVYCMVQIYKFHLWFKLQIKVFKVKISHQPNRIRMRLMV